MCFNLCLDVKESQSIFTYERYAIMPVFSLNTGKYGPEKTPYLETFNAVLIPKCKNFEA